MTSRDRGMDDASGRCGRVKERLRNYKRERLHVCIIGYEATGSRLTEGQQQDSGASSEAEQRFYEQFSLGILCDSTYVSRYFAKLLGQAHTRASSGCFARNLST